MADSKKRESTSDTEEKTKKIVKPPKVVPEASDNEEELAEEAGSSSEKEEKKREKSEKKTVPSKKSPLKKSEKAEKSEESEKGGVKKHQVVLENYSDLAYVIFGIPKEYSTYMYEAGGRHGYFKFNGNEDDKRSGHVFAKSRTSEEKLKKLIKEITSGKKKPIPWEPRSKEFRGRGRDDGDRPRHRSSTVSPQGRRRGGSISRESSPKGKKSYHQRKERNDRPEKKYEHSVIEETKVRKISAPNGSKITRLIPEETQMQTVTYNVIRPVEGMNVEIKLESGVLKGTVDETTGHDDIIDTAFIKPSGKKSDTLWKLGILNGRWQIVGTTDEHEVLFSLD
jgi:hypothetical protein